MPYFLKKSTLRVAIFTLVITSIAAVSLLFLYNRVTAIILLILFIIAFFYLIKQELILRKNTREYITDFSQRFAQISGNATAELPIGILVYNNVNEIEWVNQHLKRLFEEKVGMGESIEDLSMDLFQMISKKTNNIETIRIEDRVFQVIHKQTYRLIYLTDITDQVELQGHYHDEKTVLGIIFVDNYDDITQGMDDSEMSNIRNLVTSELNKWAKEHEIYLRRVSSDRFIAIMNERILADLEKTKFDILDEIREAALKIDVSATLSIGIGSGEVTLPALSDLAQSGLDLALGRGGDQVTIKMLNGKTRFYGGKTNPTGKRTRVRARVVSHALRDLILDSQNVVIMGHRFADMDVLGSAIGLLRIAEINETNAHIVIDKEDVDDSVLKFLEDIKKCEEIYKKIISVDKALELIHENTLIIVVDTHRPSLVLEEKLLKGKSKIVIIDHHRRGEDVIENPILSYMEPYASSTAELVTELLEYHPTRKKIDSLEATALLAGIMVDTKSFTLRTGARTFDAASFLRLHDADMAVIQTVLKENINEFIEKNKLIEKVYFYKSGLAITKGKLKEPVSRALIAKAADTLLSMENVNASFVIAEKEDGVAISSRSLGDINVQLIMEKLNGGGHLSNAATQLSNITIDEAEQQLKLAIDEYLEGRNK